MTASNRDIILRAKAAAAALQRGPADAELAVAPKIDQWLPLVSPDGTPVLWGSVSDHPLLGNDDVLTSRLFGLNPVAGWARTFSRWYVLGAPFSGFEDLISQGFGTTEVPPQIMFSGFPGHVPMTDPALLDMLLHDFLRRLDAINPDDIKT